MLRNIIVGVTAVFVIVIGVVAYSFFKTPEAATTSIVAAPLNLPTPAPETEETLTSANSADVAPASMTIYEIIPSVSEARFLIDEVLKGEPVTVVGATDQVAGQFAIDPLAPATAQVGVIQINARTLTTDNDFRNRAIKNRILVTDTYEYIIFTPTSITELPASGNVGETYTFQMQGNLTVKDITRQATFDVTVTPVSETRLEGTASTTVMYADYKLAIPDSPSVDTVADEVRLELEFAAEAL